MKVRVPRAIKSLTDPLVGRIPVRIRGGVNQGMRWSLASAGGGHASGRWAAKELAALGSLVRAGDVVWDVGAHHGYMTLCLARRAGPSGQVHAIEPSARNRWFLGRHVRWNRLSTVTVHPYAVSSFDGSAALGGGSSSRSQGLTSEGEPVEVVRVATLLGRGLSPPPTLVKIDVEGAEGEILRDGLADLGESVRLLISIHSEDVYGVCMRGLAEAGFTVVESGQVLRNRSTGWRRDGDVYAFGPAWPHGEEDLAVLRGMGFSDL